MDGPEVLKAIVKEGNERGGLICEEVIKYCGLD
jgi:hypothetical protein